MTQRRVRFVVLIGALATVFSLADFLWFLGAPLPPVGAVLCIVFLYVLAESRLAASAGVVPARPRPRGNVPISAFVPVAAAVVAPWRVAGRRDKGYSPGS